MVVCYLPEGELLQIDGGQSMMLNRKLLLGILIAVLVAGCAAPRPAQPQQVAPTATPTRGQRPTRVPQPTATATVAATPTAAASPTVAPTAAPQTATAPATPTPEPSPTATALPSTGDAAPANVQAAPTTGGKGSGVLLSLNPSKYPAPTCSRRITTRPITWRNRLCTWSGRRLRPT